MPIDIEAALVSYFGDRGFSAYTDVSEGCPGRFIVVERVGGAVSDVVLDHPRVAIQCFAGTRAEAAAFAYEIDSLIEGLTDHPRITHVERISLYNFPDLVGKRPRYQIVVNLTTM